MHYRRSSIVLIHITGWLLFIGLILGFAVSSPGYHQPDRLLLSGRFPAFCGAYLFLFYFNSYCLLPQLYLKKKYFLYFIAIVALFLLIYYLRPFDTLISETSAGPANNQAMPPGDPPPPMPGQPGRSGPQIDIVSIVLFVMVWSFSAAIQLVKQWQTTERRAAQAEADKANAELSFLKAQINPHFLFNTLNNIYAMAVSKAAQTPDAIMKLSNIMRYVTDEVSGDFGALESEIACIADYIELQKLKLNEKVMIDLKINGNVQERRIAPLILMTFVENAFKYGVSNHIFSPVTIHLKVTNEGLTFFCQNKVFGAAAPFKNTGIGIENNRKRLQHLYPGRHLLSIAKENNLYTVQLTLQLT